MKITRKQLRKIIREEYKKQIKETGPRMSGILSPEDPSVMADIERSNTMGLEEKVEEWYSQEIADLALILYYEGSEISMEEAISNLDSMRSGIDQASPEELEIIWRLAQTQAEEL